MYSRCCARIIFQGAVWLLAGSAQSKQWWIELLHWYKRAKTSRITVVNTWKLYLYFVYFKLYVHFVYFKLYLYFVYFKVYLYFVYFKVYLYFVYFKLYLYFVYFKLYLYFNMFTLGGARQSL